jgi:hypothetical protein
MQALMQRGKVQFQVVSARDGDGHWSTSRWAWGQATPAFAAGAESRGADTPSALWSGRRRGDTGQHRSSKGVSARHTGSLKHSRTQYGGEAWTG